MTTNPRAEFTGTERFMLRRQLGRGGAGVVYEAFDRDRGVLVALKTLQSADPVALYRFKREFRSLSDLTHENLAQLYELHADGDVFFFTMELVRGLHFIDAIRTLPTARGGWLPKSAPRVKSRSSDTGDPVHLPLAFEPAVLRDRLAQLVDGVHALHQAGKLHRDLKHSNVLIDQDGRVVILDFGLVTELGPKDQSHAVDRSGTPPYMSPEQLLGMPVTTASDWYSVGIMLHEIITGTLLYRGDPAEVLAQKTSRKPPPITQTQPDVPEDIAQLCDDLVETLPEKRPHADEIIERLGARKRKQVVSSVKQLPSGLIGREEQLARLHAALDDTHKGHAVLTLVHGASGIGKSALTRQFLDEVRARDPSALILSGRCYERESVPYKALDGVIDELSRHLRGLRERDAAELLPAEVHALAKLFPVLGQVPAVSLARRRATQEPDAGEQRRRGFVALRETFRRLSAKQTVVVIIDDLQWGDVDSAALLEELLRPPDAPRILLLGLYRSEERETSPLLSRFLRRRTGSVYDIELEELSPADAKRAARHQLSFYGAVDDKQAEAIAAEAGGHPFFIDELVRFSFSGASLPGGAAPDLRAAILGRIEQLPQEARRLLEVTALASRPLDRRAAAAAARIVTNDEGALMQLRTAHLIRSRRNGDEALLETYHDRIRETVLESLSPDERRFLHRHLANSLEKIPGSDPEALAHHHVGAGDDERAAELFVKAADRAVSTLAFHRAARLYGTALSLLPLDVLGRRELHERQARAHVNAGECRDAATAFLAAAETAPPEHARELRRQAAEMLLLSGHIDEGTEMFRAIMKDVGMTLPRSPLQTLTSILWSQLRLKQRGIEFEERDEERIPRERLFKIDLNRSISVGMQSGGDPFVALDFQGRYLRSALDAGEPRRIAHALAQEAISVASQKGVAAKLGVEERLSKSSALADKLGDVYLQSFVALARGIVAFWFYRFRDALREIEAAEVQLRDRCTGVWPEIAHALFYGHNTLLALDEWGELARRVPADMLEGQEKGDDYCVSNCQLHESRSCLLRSNIEGARALLEEVRARSSHRAYHQTHYLLMYYGAFASLYAGDVDSAFNLVRSEWPKLRRSLMLRVQAIRVYAHQMRGNVALAMASKDKRYLSLAERDAVQLEREQTLWSTTRAALLRAGIAQARGDESAAVASLESAFALSKEADLSLHRAVSAVLLGERVKGDRGRALVEEGNAWLSAQGIVEPGRIVRSWAPAFAP